MSKAGARTRIAHTGIRAVGAATRIPATTFLSGFHFAFRLTVNLFIRTHTREGFGPVRSVELQPVSEIAFEDIRKSPCHKSGIAVRFSRMSRWRMDKKITDADWLETLKSLLPDF